jgi:DNA-binding transcriptional MerR regulator
MGSPEPLISHADAAEYLDIPPATLHQWNHRGVGPRSYRIGKHRKYRHSDLDVFIASKASDQAA